MKLVFINATFKAYNFFQYLELRFSSTTRVLLSLISCISIIMFIPIVIYIPAIAINQGILQFNAKYNLKRT